jgi:hypothetical protein
MDMDTNQKASHTERRSYDMDIASDHETKPNDYAPAEIQQEVGNLNDPGWAIQQKRYLRKLDWIILPMISLLYFFEYLDRGNIAVSPSSAT